MSYMSKSIEELHKMLKNGEITSEELIKEALKEAVLSDVRNISYIDKIIANWMKKGYKSVEDVKRKKTIKKEEEIEEILIPDWLNE